MGERAAGGEITPRAAVYDGDTCITPETITEFERDAAGRVLRTTRNNAAGAPRGLGE